MNTEKICNCIKRDNIIVFATGIFLFLFTIFLQPEADLKMSWGVFGGWMVLLLAVIGIGSWKKNKEIVVYVAIVAFTLILIQLTSYIKIIKFNTLTLEELFYYNIFGVLVLAFGLFFTLRNKDVSEKQVYYVIIMAVALRFFYSVMTQAYLFQNDNGTFDEYNTGHLGCIYWLYEYGYIDFPNPMTFPGQHYHPPLHYAISAMALHIFRFLGFDVINSADEVIQMISVFYGTVTLVYIDKIAKTIKVPVLERILIAAIAGFLPYGIMLHTAVNNDPLVTMLMTMAIYYALSWYKKATYKNSILLAISIGCAMMTKISAAMLAPEIGVLMVLKLWKEREKIKSILSQIIVFLLISLPLGLWFPIQQNIKWGMPLGWVPRLPLDMDQTIVEYTVWERLFDFKNALDYLAVSWDRNGIFIDHNISVSAWKFAVFGEASLYNLNPVLETISKIVFYLVGLMLLGLIVCGIRYVILKNEEIGHKIIIFGSVAISVISYYIFCIKYPHVCTMNVRYIMTALYTATIMAAKVLSEYRINKCNEEVSKDRYVKILNIGMIIYMLSVVIMYWNLEIILY